MRKRVRRERNLWKGLFSFGKYREQKRNKGGRGRIEKRKGVERVQRSKGREGETIGTKIMLLYVEEFKERREAKEYEESGGGC